MRLAQLVGVCCILVHAVVEGADSGSATERGDRMIGEYFQQETERLAASCLSDVQSASDWNAHREPARRQLFEMLGLDPLPAKTPLNATVTGTVSHSEFHVENLHFQSRPGLYVTGNLYVPDHVEGKLPAVLYVCGHGGVKKDGVSYGNKVHYQHHGAWFARNGYVCLVIDTLQLGEIEGIHHGTYRHDMWWWLNYGYTSAGVEAWNCIRALDYLQSRPEVDPDRLGVTGRSGGGAYSWWIAALDERIRCAVPVAGITDLRNHVVDGCVEGHCDCMYMVNTYRWDYPQVAALVAPRPLLVSNTDSDAIFPLDGVVRLFEQTRRIYALAGARDQVALNITAGGHHDTQELQVHAFRWFNQHLKKDKSLIEKNAVPFFEPEQLRVFRELPVDERNTRIQESFTVLAAPAPPSGGDEWRRMREGWRQALQERVFGGWPREAEPLEATNVFSLEKDGRVLRAFDFTAQGPVQLRLYLLHASQLPTEINLELAALDASGWKAWLGALRAEFPDGFADEPVDSAEPASSPSDVSRPLAEVRTQPGKVLAFIAPRGIGPTAWDATPKKQVQHQRRFYLLGQSLDGMRVWDIRRAVRTLQAIPEFAGRPLTLVGDGPMAGNVLYASLFEPDVTSLRLTKLPKSHREGPYYLNVQRFLDLPMTLAMAVETTPVTLRGTAAADWEWTRETMKRIKLNESRLRLE